MAKQILWIHNHKHQTPYTIMTFFISQNHAFQQSSYLIYNYPVQVKKKEGIKRINPGAIYVSITKKKTKSYPIWNMFKKSSNNSIFLNNYNSIFILKKNTVPVAFMIKSLKIFMTTFGVKIKLLMPKIVDRKKRLSSRQKNCLSLCFVWDST